MKKIVIFILLCIAGMLLLPFVGKCQPTESDEVFIAPGYEGSADAPIIVKKWDLLRTAVDGYFINQKRYEFYRKLHEFANDADFRGQEQGILDGFGGFLAESDDILKKMADNTGRLEDASERLKTAQTAVDDLKGQVDELARQNRELNERLNRPVKVKRKWATPLFVGIAVGVVAGVLVR